MYIFNYVVNLLFTIYIYLGVVLLDHIHFHICGYITSATFLGGHGSRHFLAILVFSHSHSLVLDTPTLNSQPRRVVCLYPPLTTDALISFPEISR